MKTPLAPIKNGKSHQLPQIIAILSSSLAAVSNGLIFSWTSPSIPHILETTDITFEQTSYFTVISPISMALTTPFFSMLLDVIGRKNSVLIVAIPQLLNWIITGCATNVWMFYTARIVAGMGDAALFATVPIYVGEVAQPKVRGTWGNSVAIAVYIGLFLINVIGSYCGIQTTALICGCLPIFQVAIFSFMPESPYYLLMKGKEEQARNSLKRLRWTNDVEEELTALKADVTRQTSERGSFKELFTIFSNRKALVVCLLMRAAQQFSGIPAFEMYTQYLFIEAGGFISHDIAAMIFSGVLAMCAGLSALIVERFGRKPLMIFSCFGCGIVLTVEALYFTVSDFTNVDSLGLGWLPLVGMLMYIIICSTGIGILPTLVVGELFSTSIKAKAASIMNFGLAGCFLIIPKLFQSLTYNFGIFTPFWFFAICCYVFGFLSCFYVIETKGKTLEQIQQDLKGTKDGRTC